MNTKINKLPKSEVEIEAQIEADIFESYFNKALKILSENIEIPGFRKGKAPENILLANMPEIKILEEMAELALSEHYPKIIEGEKLDVIGRPEISITKLARKNPLEFKIKVPILPEFNLPDYKEIAKKTINDLTQEEKDTEIKKEEVEKTIEEIRKSRSKKVNTEEGGEKKEEIVLPELTDEFVQSLGNFENVSDFMQKLESNMKLEKENLVKEKTRLKIVEAIIKQTDIDLPEILIEMETNKILYKMESDVAQMGLNFEDYLKHLNKKEEDLRVELRPDSEKKAKLSLILDKIAKTENIKVDEKEILKEVDHILEHYKEADEERARAYVENIMINEKIFQLLEKTD